MATKKIRVSLVVAVVAALMALPMAGHSALVNPITSGAGITGGGNWTTGVSLGWSVADVGDDYLYSYTFQAPTPGLSHFILQTSDNFTADNIKGVTNSETYGLNTFSPGDPGNSNPGLPEVGS